MDRGLQMQTDLAIGPAGDVWVMNNWQDIASCFGDPTKRSRPVVIFFGMAKPVRAPQIGPARQPSAGPGQGRNVSLQNLDAVGGRIRGKKPASVHLKDAWADTRMAGFGPGSYWRGPRLNGAALLPHRGEPPVR
jgi:hypothetical protein